MIYFDNAATTLKKPKEVAVAVYEAINNFSNASRGSYELSLNSERIILSARERLKKLFNADSPNCIAFTNNSTEALNIAIKGLINKNDHIITTSFEHNSVLRPIYEIENIGTEVTIIKADKRGIINYNEIESNIKENTKAIICSHASNVIGDILDVSLIGKIAKKYKLIFILDASQTAGCVPIDIKNNFIDVLCFTGHKGLMGPQGTGGLCVRKDLLIKPLKTGGTGIKSYSKTHPKDMPTRLEAGTLNGHGIAGLNASLEFIENETIEKITNHERELSRYFYDSIKNIENIKFYGNYETDNRVSIVALNIGEIDSSKISDILSNDYNIATRPGAHCAPLMHEALGTVNQGIARFSFSYFNTFEEIDKGIEAIKEISSKFKK
ncbi:aminotransferase class V-fold PLP-dependent enzyme [Brachyspira aalborgi]|uniref:cysteine desulfurase n=1 Tax=Brachyspira aalborgi TaxID=29522 RepID=A0A5C8E7B2_9SPIR|nr:aminotransferase class V-fold PLP-dependent enzyme [Brachyspira aalborgi]TXJ33576.1 aminotransferase class V-fold PLP-dependent enzyme [Brachyspira aalborgi]